jgi:hypothetical protein
MQAAPPLHHPVQDSPAPQAARPPQIPQAAAHTDLWDFAEECLSQTAAILHETRSATDMEIQHAINKARESHAQGRPCDLLETIARIQGHEEEHLGKVILELGGKVAQAVNPFPPLIPFGGKLIAPSSFYDSFDHLHKVARVLLCPVIYAEDTDAIGTASANPVAPAILAREIASTVFKRFGIRPFVTIARLDYESWTFLSRKHFEL